MRWYVSIIGFFLLLTDCSWGFNGTVVRLCDYEYAVLGFVVGEATLSDVKLRLGDVDYIPRKEGEDELICYKVNDVALIFVAGAMGGWKTITGFKISRFGLFDKNSMCLPIDMVSVDDVYIGLHGKLGDTEDDIIRLYGAPHKRLENLLLYESVKQDPMSEAELKRVMKDFSDLTDEDAYWDVSCFAEFEFSNGKLTSLSFSKFSSL